MEGIGKEPSVNTSDTAEHNKSAPVKRRAEQSGSGGETKPRRKKRTAESADEAAPRRKKRPAESNDEAAPRRKKRPAENADEVYLRKILPEKMKYNLEELSRVGVAHDLGILAKTLFAALGGGEGKKNEKTESEDKHD